MHEPTLPSHRATGLRIILLAALIGASAAGRTQAIVHDPPHTVKTVMGWIQAHAQDVKELKQWQDQLQHYHQQLVSAIGLLDVSMPMTLEVEERSLDWGMAERCSNPDGSPGALPSLAQLRRKVLPNLDGDIAGEQYRVCQKIVLAGNARYNEQVRMLEFVRQRDTELRSITVRGLSVGTSQGRMDTHQAELAQFGARSASDLRYHQVALLTYDGLIQSLRDDQRSLADRALRGNGGTLIGTVVQGATLKTALQAARQRDR